MSTLNTVSILDFRKNIYKHLGSLPLIVTAKGKALFKIVKVEEDIQAIPGLMRASELSARKKQVKDVFDVISLERLKRPLICPKHNGQLIGGKYSCCE